MYNITAEAGIIRKLALLAIVFRLLSSECCLFVHGVTVVSILTMLQANVWHQMPCQKKHV